MTLPLPTEAVAGSLFSWVDADGNTQTLDVDVVMSANDKRSMKMTDHVVEDGATITDHIVLLPEIISMDLLVTQTPFPTPSQAASALSLTGSKQKLSEQKVELKIPPNNFQPGGFLLLSQGARQAVGAVAGALLGAAGLAPGNTLQGSKAEVQGTNLTAQVYQPADGDRVGAVHDKLIEIMVQALRVTVSFKGRLYIDYLLTEVELNQSFGHGKFQVQARALHTVSGESVDLPDPADFRAIAKATKGNKNTKVPDPDPKKAMKSAAKHTAGFINKVAGALGGS